MYWLNLQSIIVFTLASYLIGTIVGVYLASVSVLGAIVWLVVGTIVVFGSMFFAGKDWGKIKQKQK
jgi:hypothetical protein